MSRYVDIEPYEKCVLQRYYRNSMGECVETVPLCGLPIADVAEVRHGRWIENETSYADPPTKQTCNCSICGKASTRPLGDWCRWCGAKMDGDNIK